MSINLHIPNDIYFSEENFDLSFMASNSGVEITNFTGYKFVINGSNSYSISQSDYSSNSHRFTKIKDNYNHVLLPLNDIADKYPCIQISTSNTELSKYNGYYYFDDTSAEAWDNAKSLYDNCSTSLVLRHERGPYQLRANIKYLDGNELYGNCYILELFENDVATKYFFIGAKETNDGPDEQYQWSQQVQWNEDCRFSFRHIVEQWGYQDYETIENSGIIKKDIPLIIASKDYSIKIKLKNGANISPQVTKNLMIKKDSPTNAFLQLTGSTEQIDYTGFYQKHGRFFPSSFITAEYSATDKQDMGVSIFINSNSTSDGKLAQGIKLKSNITKVSQLLLPQMMFGNTIINKVRIDFTDIAGNVSSIEKSIRQNNVLSRLAYDNLVENTQVLRDNDNALIVQTTVSDTNTYYRAWNEYWFPETHKLPTFNNGVLDEQTALAMAKMQTWTDAQYRDFDRAKSNSGQLLRDNQGRVLQDWNDTKYYENGINDWMNGTNITSYCIINPQDISDFRLEFEYFYLNTSINSTGQNKTAYNLGYKGDVLVVYDATAEGCTKKKNNNGITTYTLEDLSKLKRLFAIKGSSADGSVTVKDFTNEELSNSYEKLDKGLITSSINCNLICLIPYTDRGQVSTGFKLKAGPKIQYEYRNYDINYETGEIWVHPQNNNYAHKLIYANYRYYQNSIGYDNEKGTVALSNKVNDSPMVGNVYVYLNLSSESNSVPFQYMNGQEIKTFLTTQDDFQDYSTPFFYCSPDEDYLSSYVKQQEYDITSASPKGRLSNFFVNKDEGFINFNNTVTPIGRIFGSYYYHTLYRLTSDGYGDLQFYQNILVPATDAEGYQDWTYVDLMVINEGTANLTSGSLKLLPRGYVSSGTTVDTVLDNNRPWDQQQGSLAQTVNQCGGYYDSSYQLLKQEHEANRSSAIGARNITTIAFGSLSTKSRGFFRIFWTLANSESSWIQCTRGNKLFSAELAGTYNSFSID